jgi:hypothetical protein
LNKFAVALAVLLSATTASAAPLARDLDNNVVNIDIEAVSVTWSLACIECRQSLRQLDRLRALGVPVVAINTDPPSSRSQVAHYLRRHRMSELTVVQMHVDQVPDNTPMMLSASGNHVVRHVMSAMPRSMTVASK